MKHVRLLAASAALLAAGSTAAMAADVKVGSAAGITGPIEGLVPPILAGRNLAATHVNEQGGILGGGTYMLVPGDSQCNPKAAVDAGTKLVHVEQVVAVIGPSCSGATNGMAQSVNIPAGVVTLSDSATAPMISFLEDDDLVFRAAPSDGYQSGALAQHVWDKGLRKIAVTYANDDYNAGLGEAFIAAFEQIGGTISGKQAHEPDRQSYRSELSTLAGGGAEALAVFAYYGGSGITILRNSLENALFDQFLGADGMMDNSVIEQLGADTLRGKVTLSQPAPEAEGDSGPGESYTAFAEAFKAAGHDPAAPYVSHGYDVAFLMALAIEKAGAADRGLISAALREVANAPGMVIRPASGRRRGKPSRPARTSTTRARRGPSSSTRTGTSPGRPTPSTVSATTGPGPP